MSVTGRFRFRRSLLGKVVMEVEEEVTSWSLLKHARVPQRRWRDANIVDLARAEMRVLMDMRLRPTRTTSPVPEEALMVSMVEDLPPLR
ncbi:MAG TPA: hypothetical protein VEA41_21315 [Salinarimonas sp.]|nr:hypothetical protein [Salinarimonas sp.]